jgi:acyl-coenzyme A thioesterase PaaI-like protein
LSAGIPRVVPIAGGLRIKVDEVDDEHAATSMPFTRRSRNHVGSIYLGALLVQAEVTMATLVIGLCRAPRFRVLVLKNEAEFHAKARRTVRAVCEPHGEEREALAKCRALVDERADAWLTVRMKERETPIATVRFLITVRHKSA